MCSCLPVNNEPADMPHRWFPHPSFLLGEPFQEQFVNVDQATSWCSQQARCRGFTISLTHMQDGHLHFVRFFDRITHVLSAEWLSYVKEPTTAWRYSFSPGYLTYEDGDALLHQQYTTAFDASRYCDAEPACVGFVLRRQPAVLAAEAASERAWFGFVGTRLGVASPADSGLSRRLLSVFDGESVTYRKTAPLVVGEEDGRVEVDHGGGGAVGAYPMRTYALHYGFLADDAGAPLERHVASLDEAVEWCDTHTMCVGFCLPTDPSADRRPSEADLGAVGRGVRLWVTYWPVGTRLVYSTEWVTYAAEQPALGAYLMQPGYLLDSDAGYRDCHRD